MTENSRLYTKALMGFDAVAAQAASGDWDRPAPCAGWTARHVIGHVLAIQHGMVRAIAGEPRTMNPMESPEQWAGDDPYSAWATQRDAMLAAAADDATLERVVETFRGPRKVDDSIGWNVNDTTIHTWDLARALGVDDTLDPELVEAVLRMVEPVADTMRQPMMFGPAVDVAPDADAQTRMLALTGRCR